MERFLIHKKNNDYNIDNNEYFTPGDENEEPGNICKLKIKIPLIDRIIFLNTNKNSLIKDILDFLKGLLNKFNLKVDNNFSLISTFPLKEYTNNDVETLEKLGFFPSHFLIYDCCKYNI